jgi:DNA-binding response OmpR family regulator
VSSAALRRASRVTIMHVLFVEDDERLCNAFRDLARASGHHADVAYDGHQAMLLAVENRYDTIFLNISLPDVDGRDLCRRLRAAGPSKLACVVAVTGDDRHNNIGLEHFDGYFVKPFTEEGLRAALDAC